MLLGSFIVQPSFDFGHHGPQRGCLDWGIHLVAGLGIRFEFDRKRTFEILSDQIYQGRVYIFLRELLQNSIDAVRTRRGALDRRGVPAGELGTIRVHVDHRSDGNIDVAWTDDGAGMDDYIVKNFLAVAGKSYYTSKEFEDEGFQFDPISKFGIGLLSCFMVADRVAETRENLLTMLRLSKCLK